MSLEEHRDRIRKLFEEYYLSLVEFAKRIIKSEENARDLVQSIFVKLLERESVLPENQFKIKSYLYSMAKNAALNYNRHQQVINNYIQENSRQEITEEDILEALIYGESIYKLHNAIKKLPKACQEVCTLTYIEEKTNSEVAEFNQKSINTVKTHKRRAIELLREQLIPSK